MGEPVAIPPFAFRIEAREVESYRRALGVAGSGIPLGMALRALASETVLSRLRQMAGGRSPIHIAQDYRVEQPLRAGTDYVCDVVLKSVAEGRVRVEQRLRGSSGETCVVLGSDIALVDP